MDEKQVEALGVSPIKPLLAEIDGLADIAGVEKMIGRFHELGVPVPFGLTASPDRRQPTQVIADVFASGLGLPDRDYYVKTEKRFQEAREKYRVYVAHMIELSGKSRAESRRMAEAVFGIEKQLALASLDSVSRREAKATDHKTSFVDLTNLAPDFDWVGYVASAKLPRAALNVQQPAFLKAMDDLLLEAPLLSWKAYLRWHLVRSAAPYLSAAFVQEQFAFEEQYLGGAKEMKPRCKRCVESTDLLLGEALGRKYVEKYFAPGARARVQELVKSLLLAMGDTLRDLDWMSAKTKAKALEKLATVDARIGHPDTWKDYATLDVARDTLWANVANARKWNVDDDRAQIGKPVDRSRWRMTPPTSRRLLRPAAQPGRGPGRHPAAPGLQPERDRRGELRGDRRRHRPRDQPRLRRRGRATTRRAVSRAGGPGRPRDVREARQCVVDQFDGYFVEPDLHHDGKLVLGESIGDLAGVRIAYRAFLKSLEGKPPAPPLDGFTPEQQFFIAWGQFRGDAIREETQRLMVQSDPHPIGKFRVIGPLSNLPEFQKAFACPADAPMVRPVAKRCEVW